MTLQSIGVVATSFKENEQRVAIHPRHIAWIPMERRKHLVFEEGYGSAFSVTDDEIRNLGAQIDTRQALFERCDVILNPKPVLKDFQLMREGSCLWGWPHCVQQKEFAQIAVDRRLTLIAWESMFTWSKNGQKLVHVFYKNNEMAGYCGVLDALRLTGCDGHYGPRKKVAVLSFGSVSRGAICALQGRGFHDIDVYTRRPAYSVGDQVPGLTFRQFTREGDGRLQAIRQDGKTRPFHEVISEAHIIVNGTLQDTDCPTMFVQEDEVNLLKPDSLIIDISCDDGMGFPFAKPTSIEVPIFTVRDNVTYYAVDHTPTYLWNAASWEISKSISPFIEKVMDGPDAWDKDLTLKNAIEIRMGVIQNSKILRFQNRSAAYPHPVLKD